MSEQTVFLIKEAKNEPGIFKIEETLNQLSGIERVLIDTADGEVKVEFDERIISKEQMMSTLIEKNFTILQ